MKNPTNWKCRECPAVMRFRVKPDRCLNCGRIGTIYTEEAATETAIAGTDDARRSVAEKLERENIAMRELLAAIRNPASGMTRGEICERINALLRQ